MNLDRPQLYYFLLPFTIISLFLYFQILFEIYRKRKLIVYRSFFYRMICSQSVCDISYVVMYFVMEIPQDWPSMYHLLTGMNGSVLPQLVYAHVYLCLIAQCLGVTIMSISRLFLVSHPTHSFSRFLKHLSLQEVVFYHFVLPTAYAFYILLGQDWRSYDYERKLDRLTRIGSEESITLNSNILCALSSCGAVISAVCYIRVFVTLRRRPYRKWRSEISILVTSLVLFFALCTLAAYYICNLIFIGADWAVFYTIRKHFYAFSFFLSLANPWCLMISGATLRNSIARRCLPSFSTRLQLCPPSNPKGTADSSVQRRNRANPPVSHIA